MSTQDDILTVEEVAEYLNVSKYPIWRMIKRGDKKLKGVASVVVSVHGDAVAQRRWRISRFAILKWLEGKGNAKTTHQSVITQRALWV